MVDVIVIGAGVTGCGVARELSRTDLSVLVLERAADVCEGTSKANSGIVHAGYDAVPGTLKARLNVEGNRMMGRLAEELDFPFRQDGSLVLCLEEKDREKLQKLYDQGQKNGVPGLEILEREELLKLEPNLSDSVVAALYAPTGGIVCPFGLTIALAENAAVNGVEFRLNTEVYTIQKHGQADAPIYRLETSQGTFESRAVVNAAGVYADCFHNMVSEDKLRIVPRKGEYFLMDKKVGGYVRHTLFQLPTAYGKGVLVTPTVHGNLLAGPTAVDVEDAEALNTTSAGQETVLQRAALSVKSLPSRETITSFAGLRAHVVSETMGEIGDFVLGQAKEAPGFFDAVGIESPGLSCAPALAVYLAELVLKYLPAEQKKDFIAARKGIPSMELASEEERRMLIQENSLYANVVCRCELVTEGEIVDSIHRPLGAVSLDGVKRRTRAGMGRCQSGFCAPKVAEILARELHKDLGEIGKRGQGSELLTGCNKDEIEAEPGR